MHKNRQNMAMCCFHWPQVGTDTPTYLNTELCLGRARCICCSLETERTRRSAQTQDRIMLMVDKVNASQIPCTRTRTDSTRQSAQIGTDTQTYLKTELCLGGQAHIVLWKHPCRTTDRIQHLSRIRTSTQTYFEDRIMLRMDKQNDACLETHADIPADRCTKGCISHRQKHRPDAHIAMHSL